MRIACAIVALAACGDRQSSDTDGGGDSPPAVSGWSMGADVARGAIQETAAVAIAGKIYVLGGIDAARTTVRYVQIYDTATNAWSDGPDLPRALHHANAVTDGTTIYVLGALAPNFDAIGDAYSWNPATDAQWSTLMAMPAGRERGAAVAGVIDGKFYIAGGFRTLQASDLLDVYDPAANSWAPLAPLPAIRDHACGGAINGAMIFAGGRTVQTNSPRPDVWSYNPAVDVWTPQAPMPTGRGGMGCGVIAGKLYTAGGEGNGADPSGVFPNVEAFDPAANAWSTLDPMANPKHGVGGAVWNGALYLCGGASMEGFGAIAATDIFRP